MPVEQSRKLRFLAAGKTDVGRIRRNNEDCFGMDMQGGLFVVCDGVGGRACGEVASTMARDTILARFSGVSGGRQASSPMGVSASSRLRAALEAANHAVFNAGAAQGQPHCMGTTVVAAVLDNNRLTVAHVGDSRAYLIRNQKLQALTQDHSLIASYLCAGIMTPEEAATSSLQNVILRAVGAEPQVEPDLKEIEVQGGDIILLCTDGLSGQLDESQILRIAGGAPDLDSACEQLIAAANAAGGKDNVTALLIKLADAKLVDAKLEDTQLLDPA